MKTFLVPFALGIFAMSILSPATVRAGSTAEHEMHPSADADNTKKNVRDKEGDTLTPLDQGGSEADRTITQKIRKAVVAHDDLSMNAKNVKIITVDGAVTLRGPVKSTAEKSAIAKIAKDVAGTKNVDDQLEVESN